MRRANDEMVLARWHAGQSINAIAKQYRRDRRWVESCLKRQGVSEFRRSEGSGRYGPQETRQEKWDAALK